MVVDISKITLENIQFYAKLGNHRKGEHLTDEEKAFYLNLKQSKEKPIIKTNKTKKNKLSEEERKQYIKQYQHMYYLKVTKIKRKIKRRQNKCLIIEKQEKN